jgi:hypothetical protein
LRVVGRILFGTNVEDAIPVIRDAFPRLSEHIRRRARNPLRLPRRWPVRNQRRAAAQRSLFPPSERAGHLAARQAPYRWFRPADARAPCPSLRVKMPDEGGTHVGQMLGVRGIVGRAGVNGRAEDSHGGVEVRGAVASLPDVVRFPASTD